MQISCIMWWYHMKSFDMIPSHHQLIGLREKLQENPMIFMGKSGWFPVKIFPFLSTHWAMDQTSLEELLNKATHYLQKSVVWDPMEVTPRIGIPRKHPLKVEFPLRYQHVSTIHFGDPHFRKPPYQNRLKEMHTKNVQEAFWRYPGFFPTASDKTDVWPSLNWT